MTTTVVITAFGDELQDSEVGWVAALAASRVSSLASARRDLRAQLYRDAGAAAAPRSSYRCSVFIGWPEINRQAEVIREWRPRMEANPNPLDHLEYCLSELHAIGTDDDPPVLLFAVLPLVEELPPATLQRLAEATL